MNKQKEESKRRKTSHWPFSMAHCSDIELSNKKRDALWRLDKEQVQMWFPHFYTNDLCMYVFVWSVVCVCLFRLLCVWTLYVAGLYLYWLSLSKDIALCSLIPQITVWEYSFYKSLTVLEEKLSLYLPPNDPEYHPISKQLLSM